MIPGPRPRLGLRLLRRQARGRRGPETWWRPLVCSAALATGALLLAWWALPMAARLPPALRKPPAPSPVLLDRSGAVLDHFPRRDLFRHRPAAPGEIPPALVDATLAAEDKRFFRHDGMDYLATARAARDLLRERRVVSGASTITQQLVKISSPPVPRNLATKLREALAARRLEMRRTKKQILAAYLNRLDYGHHRQGCREAARFYFGKPLGDLSLAECALLAGLPQSPSLHDPHRHPESALQRRNWILARLRRELNYDPSRISAAMAEPLRLSKPRGARPAPHLAARVRSSRPAGGPARIRTTVDGRLQREINAIVREELDRLGTSNVRHAAVVVIENATGEILCLVGSGDFTDPRGGQINGALAPRSAGSTLKPFTYLLAFERLGLFPGSVIADIPTPYRTAEGLDLPVNYDRRHHGPVTIRHALANSLNVSAMRTLNRLGGPEPLHDFLRTLGLTTLDRPPAEYGLGLTIGNAEVRLVELTNAYATLARLGRRRPAAILPSSSGAAPSPWPATLLPEHAAGPAGGICQVTTPQAAWLIADILADNGARSGAFGPRSALRLPFRCAAKTGTSSDFRDNWCLGFTADFTVGVWTGNFDAAPMRGVSGVSGAGPIFHRAMLACHRDRPARWLLRPDGLTAIRIDTRTGRHFLHDPPPGHPFVSREFCFAKRLPSPVRPADYDDRGRALLPPLYLQWFESEDNTRRDDLAMATTPVPRAAPEILVPLPAVTYLVDPELPSGGLRLRLQCAPPASAASWSSPTLRIDGDTAFLEPGRHQIILTDPRTGRTATRSITVESL